MLSLKIGRILNQMLMVYFTMLILVSINNMNNNENDIGIYLENIS